MNKIKHSNFIGFICLVIFAYMFIQTSVVIMRAIKAEGERMEWQRVLKNRVYYTRCMKCGIGNLKNDMGKCDTCGKKKGN